jgi:hypothetical protein
MDHRSFPQLGWMVPHTFVFVIYTHYIALYCVFLWDILLLVIFDLNLCLTCVEWNWWIWLAMKKCVAERLGTWANNTGHCCLQIWILVELLSTYNMFHCDWSRILSTSDPRSMQLVPFLKARNPVQSTNTLPTLLESVPLWLKTYLSIL